MNEQTPEPQPDRTQSDQTPVGDGFTIWAVFKRGTQAHPERARLADDSDDDL